MTLSYALIVNGPVYGTQSSFSALQFARAVIEEGHQLKKVFFYQDGVLNGSRFTIPANDELNLKDAWLTLAEKHNILLEACVAASLRRGIISNEEALLHQLDGNTIHSGFVLAGLGSLSEILLTEDRVVQF